MNTSIVDSQNKSIFSSRLIDASQDVVFKAFSNPENLKHWWGPNGFTNTIEQFEFKPGGTWKFTMHSPDGTDYHNHCEFKEIVEGEKIVFVHHQPVHQFDMTLGFEAVGNKTRFSFTMVFEDDGEVERITEFVVPANEENFDKLEHFIYKNLK
jgi:uncharacterized protein YndB with AHSA1/START domain